MAKYKYTVTAEDKDRTINRIIRGRFDFSHRFKTKIKYQGLIDLNGVKTPGFVIPKAGDIIEIRLPEETSDFTPEDIPISVLYEDDDLLLVDKQPGIIVHPTKGHPVHTIANGVMKYVNDTDQSFKIRFANRLDMDTSGIVIIAKNANAQNDISHQMRTQHIIKKYIAIVKGIVEEDEFTIDLPVGRPTDDSVQRAVMYEGGKDAVTDVKVLERFASTSLVELTLHTGRTHQLRVHMSHIGHPIVGDHLYGGSMPWLIDRQALHAYYISFTHPMTGELLTVEAPYPDDILECLEKLRH